MSKKVKAITETNIKTIINLDIAATILHKDDMRELHRIINILKDSSDRPN